MTQNLNKQQKTFTEELEETENYRAERRLYC